MSSASASNTPCRFSSSSPATTPLRFKTCRAAKPVITTCLALTPSATSASSLKDVTLNPMMGQFLSMQGNDKGNATTDPDENYAREVMQLFTIGLWKLNDDGSQQLDGTGNPIPTYSNTDVKGPRRRLHRLELEHSRRLQ